MADDASAFAETAHDAAHPDLPVDVDELGFSCHNASVVALPECLGLDGDEFPVAPSSDLDLAVEVVGPGAAPGG